MTQSNQTAREPGTRPHWIAKAPKTIGRTQRLERIGVAWNRDDGGICLRLYGTQVIGEDVYLYPNDPPEADLLQ